MRTADEVETFLADSTHFAKRTDRYIRSPILLGRRIGGREKGMYRPGTSGNVRRIGDAHYGLATEWLDLLTTSMRSLDSLHLAVAHSLQVPLVTADAVLAKSARRLNIPVESLQGFMVD